MLFWHVGGDSIEKPVCAIFVETPHFAPAWCRSIGGLSDSVGHYLSTVEEKNFNSLVLHTNDDVHVFTSSFSVSISRAAAASDLKNIWHPQITSKDVELLGFGFPTWTTN